MPQKARLAAGWRRPAATPARASALPQPPAVSSTRIVDPSLTLSSTLTLTSLTTPACEDGISIDALSDSTMMRLVSTATVSPAFTKTSITATSLKSPISGTFTSIC